MKVYGELEKAQVENLSADPSDLYEGRVWAETTNDYIKVYQSSNTKIISNEFVVFTDQKANGTNGQGLTGTTWNLRDLNVTYNPYSAGWPVLTSNKIVLPAGTYVFSAVSPIVITSTSIQARHQARLYNYTTGSTALIGTSGVISAAAMDSTFFSHICGTVVIGTTTSFGIQHYHTEIAIGGQASGLGIGEAYTQVVVQKLA